MKDFLARIGTFFILMGIGSLLLFIASDASMAETHSGRVYYELLCVSVLLFMVGILFRRTGSPPPAAERFRYIKKIQERREAAKKDKAKAQQEKK